MADIKNIISVLVQTPGQLASTVDMNTVCIITKKQFTQLGINNRTETFLDAASVGQFFGTTSDEYDHALTFFGTKPNAVDAGGRLVYGYWDSLGENFQPTTATLTSPVLSESEVVAALQQIQDASIQIETETGLVAISNMDFRTSTTLQEIVDIIAGLVAGSFSGTAVLNADNTITIFSNTVTTGITSTLTYLTDPEFGTYIGNILQMTATSGAELLQGQDAGFSGGAEAAVDALDAIKQEVNFKGVVFIDAQNFDNGYKPIAEWCNTNNTLCYETFTGPDKIALDVTNPVWDIKLSGLKNYRMLFSKSNQRKLATSYMARTHVAKNSALTMHLKELNVTPEDYTQSEIDSSKKVGLDIYTTTKNVPEVLSSGANDYTDNSYNLIAFVDALQVAGYNSLKGTSTKVAQTVQGVAKLTGAYEGECEKFSKSNFIAPGAWNSTDTFGDVDTFNRNIELNGYYVLAQKLSDQSQVDREARKAPPVQIAIKYAGAIHSSEVIVNINK